MAALALSIVFFLNPSFLFSFFVFFFTRALKMDFFIFFLRLPFLLFVVSFAPAFFTFFLSFFTFFFTFLSFASASRVAFRPLAERIFRRSFPSFFFSFLRDFTAFFAFNFLKVFLPTTCIVAFEDFAFSSAFVSFFRALRGDFRSVTALLCA